MIEQMYNTEATIWERTKISDAYGGWSDVWDEKYVDIRCRWQPKQRITKKTGGEEGVYGKEAVVQTGRMYCSSKKYTITGDEQVEIDGQYYDIVYPRDVDKMGHHYEIDLEGIVPDIR